jgi:hypothetical protein
VVRAVPGAAAGAAVRTLMRNATPPRASSAAIAATTARSLFVFILSRPIVVADALWLRAPSHPGQLTSFLKELSATVQ